MEFPYNRVLEIRADYKKGRLTREEATESLGFVLDLDDKTDTPHVEGSYGPLLRLSDVCHTLRLWGAALKQALNNSDTVEAWQKVDLAINKSNLLSRLFFTKENLRTEPCPEHKGHWSGCFMEGPNGPCRCQHEGNVTGWLPRPGYSSDLDHWDPETKAYKK
jgi:hypothetical protein